MKNPFQYGSVVSEEAFCNRTDEIARLLRIAENAGKALVYSERRFGKTSLIKLVLARLPKKRYITIYVDLWPTDSEAGFIKVVAKAITESLSTVPAKWLEAATTFFSRLKPTLKLDEDGKPNISFEISKADELSGELSDVLDAAERVAKGKKKTVVIVFDEIQQITEYPGDSLEKRLRSVIQHHRSVSYFFLGSRKHIIEEMFLEKDRPLYRSAEHFPLMPIPEKEWIPFIRERFLRAHKTIQDEKISQICRLTEGHPFYTQHLCHALWETCEQGDMVTDALVAEAVQTVLTREEYAYTVLWESLTRNQQRLLKALAAAPKSSKPFSSEFVQRYELGSPSSSQRAAQVLLTRDIIDHDDGTLVILDRFFRLWIQKVQVINS